MMPSSLSRSCIRSRALELQLEFAKAAAAWTPAEITKSHSKLVQICLLLKLCCGKGHKRGHGGEWPRLERSMTIVPNVICAVPFRGRNGSKEPEVQEDHE